MPSLNFKGKALVQNFHLLVPFHELKPVKAKSLTKKPSLHDNLVVHGDNLKALKSLLPYYHGKVKCIYTDPPYNTGNVKTKGLHLKNENTAYKQSVFALCNEHAKKKAWNDLVPAMRDKEISYEVVFQDEWEKRLNELLA